MALDTGAETLDFQVNWADSYRISYEFKTEVITSRSGREQRRALRTTPRKTVEHETVLSHAELTRFNRLIARSQHRAMNALEITRFAVISKDVPAGATVMTLAVTPEWVVEGASVGLRFSGDLAFYEVVSVANDQITLDGAVSAAWPAGTKVHPILLGNLTRQIRAPRQTNTTARATLVYEVEPASEPVINEYFEALEFNGREVFLMKPNWSQDISVSYEHEIETVDFGYGRIAKFMPINFGTTLFEANYVARNSQEAEALRAFFVRMIGQQGEFYMPSWEEDLDLRSSAFAGANTIRVKGAETFAAYKDDTVHRAVAIFLRDGRRAFGRVVNFYQITDVFGADTVLEMADSWPFDIEPDRVLMACWMPVRRHATDTLTIEWITDTVAQTKLSLKTLEALAPEGPAIISRRAGFSGRGEFASGEVKYLFPQNYIAPFSATGTFTPGAPESLTVLSIDWAGHASVGALPQFNIGAAFASTAAFEVKVAFDMIPVDFNAAGKFAAEVEQYQPVALDLAGSAVFNAANPTWTMQVATDLKGTGVFNALPRFDMRLNFAGTGLFSAGPTAFGVAVAWAATGIFTAMSANYVGQTPAEDFPPLEDEFDQQLNGSDDGEPASDDLSVLFSAGQQGGWYDPADTETLFQDVEGTQPVTADGQLVALMRDKSGRGNHVVQATEIARPTYRTDGILRWLAFDGADDFMASSTQVPMPAAANVIMATGVQSDVVNPNTVARTVIGFYATTTRYLDLRYRPNAATASHAFAWRSGSQIYSRALSFDKRVSCCLVASLKDGRRSEVYRNGSSLLAEETAEPPLSALGNCPVQIGAAGLTMRFYGGLVLLDTASSENVAMISRVLAEKAGADASPTA